MFIRYDTIQLNMRAGATSLQQALTTEAASIVKQSVILARRRGHAQVTPLHVANTMLSSSAGLLRTACMQSSHSHPLQCKALELCFNVALNRLPTTTTATSTNGSPHFHQHPSLSNALVAAFKRAQAHQRRGSIESQQQPLLAVKVEVEQLIISILDDPSVSRVMREAGFSSTQVKNNVELSVSVEITSSDASLSKPKDNLGVPILSSGLKSSIFSGLECPNSEDVATLVDNLVSRRKKCIAIVGESLVTAESVVKGLMAKIDKGEIPEPLKGAQLITLPLFPYGHSCVEDVQQKLRELRCALKSCIAERGALLYVGDLKWAADFRESYGVQTIRNTFCPIDYIVFEIGRLVSKFIESGRFWMLGIASYQTLIRCQTGNPSLESLWGLQPLIVPVASLGLTLNTDSDLLGKNGGFDKQLTCCADCLTKFELDVQRFAKPIHDSSNNSHLPSWLQQCKAEKKISTNSTLDPFQISRELFKKWNSICNAIHRPHRQTENSMRTYFHSPSSSTKLLTLWPPSEQNPLNDSWGQERFHLSEEQTFILEVPSSNSSPDSILDRDAKFKQFNAESLKSLCHALELKASQYKDTISQVASVVLQVRSGMVRRKGVKGARERKEDTWLLFEGGDTENKESIAKELASQVFCHENSFLCIGQNSVSSLSSGENQTRKRCRQESTFSYIDKLVEAIIHNPHRVIFLDGVCQADCHTHVCLRRAIERGVVIGPEGDDISLSDAIIILSWEGFGSTSRACSPCVKQKSGDNIGELVQDNEGSTLSAEKADGASPCISLDLNLSLEENESMDQCCEVDLAKYVDRRFVFEINDRAETS